MTEEQKLIVMVRSLLEKKFKDSTELFPEFDKAKKIDVVRSPSAIINAITVVGGFPRARVTEIYGPESTGKTTIGIEVCRMAQQECLNQVPLYIDFEHAFDAAYAHSLGLDLNPEKFIFSQPDYFEQGEEVIKQFLVDDHGNPRSILSVIVLDSAAAMTPRDELLGKVDAPRRPGLQADLMSRLLSKITKFITKGSKPALIILNQTRTKFDFKDPRNTGEQAAGGRALKFYTTIRIQLEIIRKEGEEKRSKDPTRGTDQVYTQHRVRMTAVKNKVGPPWVRGSLVFEFGKGINNIASVAELAEAKLGIMSGAGFFKYEGEKPETSFQCRGREAFLDILTGSPDTLNELEAKVLASIRQEHSKALGISDIKISGDAKVIEDTGDMVLETEEAGTGEGMPTEVLE